MRNLLATFCLAIPVALSGCANPEMGFPQPFRSGSAPQQRARAQHFDPFPDYDAGGGDIDGGRPRDYEQQIPEPARSRWTLPKFLSRRPVPPPMAAPMQGGPPTVVIPQGPAMNYPTTGYPGGGVAPPAGYPQSSYAPSYPQATYPQASPAPAPVAFAPAVYSGGHVAGGGAYSAGS